MKLVPGSLPDQCQPPHHTSHGIGQKHTEEVVGPSEAANSTSTKADIYIMYIYANVHTEGAKREITGVYVQSLSGASWS